MSRSPCDLNILFDTIDTNCTSPIFCVVDKPVVVRGYDLGPDERIVVEMVGGAGGQGEFFEQVQRGCGCCLTLTACSNELILLVSGTYRLNRCVCDVDGGANSNAFVQWQTVDSGVTNFGSNEMACACKDGSQVSVVRNPDASVTIVVDGVPTTISAPSTSDSVAAVQVGSVLALTVNGVTHQLDIGPDTPTDVAALFNLQSCAGAFIAPNTRMATCNDLTAAINALPPIPTAFPPSGPAGGALSGTYPNPGISGTAAASALAFTSCAGAAITTGTTLATCNDLNAAIAGIPGGPSTLPPSGAAGGALTGTYPNPGLNALAVTSLASVTLNDAFGVLIGHLFP